MPYIPQNQRPDIDAKIADLITHLKSLPLEQQDGSLNYTVTRIIHELYPEKYFHYNRAMGVLSSIQSELYRKKIAPYEDTKSKKTATSRVAEAMLPGADKERPEHDNDAVSIALRKS